MIQKKTGPLLSGMSETQVAVRSLLTGPSQARFSAPQTPRCHSHLWLQQGTLTAHRFEFLQVPEKSKGHLVPLPPAEGSLVSALAGKKHLMNCPCQCSCTPHPLSQTNHPCQARARTTTGFSTSSLLSWMQTLPVLQKQVINTCRKQTPKH